MHADRDGEPAMLGFDFPIGVPRAYAEMAGVEDFIELLRSCGRAPWREFFDVADSPDEVSLRRPFYPRTYGPKGAKRRSHLAEALGVPFESLLRRCELRQPSRRAACSLFWTCGGNQVGKGALAGWRLLQAEPRESLRIWPFDGPLEELIGTGATVVAETYPAECTGHLGLGTVSGKRHQEVRRGYGSALLDAAHDLGVDVAPELLRRVRDGFGSTLAAEDQFDSFIGLLGMVSVLEGRRAAGDPADDIAVRTVEGWILGQAAIVS
jgi:hypothetical protein